MQRPRHIAIDGPAGSGKSTVGEQLAQRLGYLYIDTGAMYRAVTWLALQKGINAADGHALERLARDAGIIIAHPHVDESLVPGHVVGSVGARYAIGLIAVVVGVRLLRLSAGPEGLTGILEPAN